MRLNTLFYNTTRRGFVVLIILFITLGLCYGIFSLRQMKIEARYFVNTTMLNLLVYWDDNEFMNHSSNELRQSLTKEKLEKINQVFNELGKLIVYHGAKGRLFRSSNAWWHINPRFKVLASFQGGQFTAIITLIKQQGEWVIGRFEYKYSYFPIQRYPGSIKLV